MKLIHYDVSPEKQILNVTTDGILVCCLILPFGCFKLLFLASRFQLGKSKLEKVDGKE